MISLRDIGKTGAVMLAVDMLTAILCAVYYLDAEMNIAFRLVLGFAFGALVLGLLMLPYIKWIARLACGGALPFVISGLSDAMLGKGLGAVREQSDIAWWTIMGAAAILFAALHLTGLSGSRRYAGETEFDADDLDDIEEDDASERMDNILERYNAALDRFEVLADTVAESGLLDISPQLSADYDAAVDMWISAGKRLDGYAARVERQGSSDRLAAVRESESYLERLLRLKKTLEDSYSAAKQQDKETRPSGGEEYSFFCGCESMAQLNKRYKSLAKVYHPDTGSGDTETMAAINAEYERVKAKKE